MSASIDPTTLWFYRVALGSIALVCLGGFIALVARAVQTAAYTAGHERAGLLQAVKDFQAGKKTYGVTIAWLGWHLYSHYQFGTPLDPAQIGEALGFSTIRAAIAKTQRTSQQAVVAAKIAAVQRPKEGV